MRAKKLKAWAEERRITHEKIEPHPEAMQSVLEHREVPVEDAPKIPVGEPKKWRRDENPAAEHRRQKPKDSAGENREPQKELAITHKTTSHRATVARRRRNDSKKETPKGTFGCQRKKLAVDHGRTIRRVNVGQPKTDILRNTTQKKCGPHERLGFASEGTTFRARVARCNRIPRKNWVRNSILREDATGYVPGRRHQMKKECSKGVRNRDEEEPLHPRKGRKAANGIAKSPVGLRRDRLDTVEGSTPSKTEKGKRPLWEEPVT